jgi:hypothetical protein
MQYSDKLLQFVKENPQLRVDGITQGYIQRIGNIFESDAPQALKDIDEALSTYHAQSKNPLIGDIVNILCLESKEDGGEIKSLEMLSSYTFCGIPLDKLTKDQKKLFDKLTPVERQTLLETVLRNQAEGQFEFANTARWPLAIQDKDSAMNVDKSSINDITKEAINGWKLPEDVDYKTKNLSRNNLYPELSDLDAMIAQMPWDTDGVKVENFRLLMDMSWPYWTWTKSLSPVVRYFNNDSRSRDYYGRYKYNHVRLVRPLKA